MILGTVTLSLLFGAVGLATDLGFGYFTKTRVQTAADTASSAAVVYALHNGDSCTTITCGVSYTCAGVTPPTNSLQAGCLYATANAPAGATVTMIENNAANPPAGVSGVTPTMWVKATVTTSNSDHLLFLSGLRAASVLASSVAGITATVSAGGGSTVPTTCLWVLDPTDKQTFLVSAGSVSLSGCTAQINSSATDPVNKQPSNSAANANGSSTLTGTYNVVGAGDYNQNYCQTGGPFVCGAASVADPLAGLRAVNETTDIGTTTCTHTSQYNPPSGATTIPSGIYCGGINIGNSNATVTFQTGGIFEIRDGGLSISNGTVSGTNVMFYFSTANPTTTADPVVNINTSSVTLSAPNSGTFKGILFYGNRAAQIAASGTNNVIQAGSSPNITGTLYFPVGNMLYSGQAGTNGGHLAIIAYRLQVNGGSAFTWDSTGGYTGLATYGSGTTTYTSSLIQ